MIFSESGGLGRSSRTLSAMSKTIHLPSIWMLYGCQRGSVKDEIWPKAIWTELALVAKCALAVSRFRNGSTGEIVKPRSQSRRVVSPCTGDDSGISKSLNPVMFGKASAASRETRVKIAAGTCRSTK